MPEMLNTSTVFMHISVAPTPGLAKPFHLFDVPKKSITWEVRQNSVEKDNEDEDALISPRKEENKLICDADSSKSKIQENR